MTLFEKFIASPYFNSVRNHTRLLSELIKFHPGFDNAGLSAEYLHERIFPGKKFNKQVMWNLSSGLEKLARDFLVQLALNKNPHTKHTLIFDELLTRGLHKQYTRELDELEKLLSSARIDSTYYYNIWLLEQSRITYWQKAKGLQNVFAENIFRSGEYLALEFLLKLYKAASDSLFFRDSYNEKDKHGSLEGVLKSIRLDEMAEQFRRSTSPNAGLIEFYCNLTQIAANVNNPDTFFRAMDFLFKNHELFKIDEKRNIVSVLENHCLFRAAEGKLELRKELFALHGFRLKNNVLTYENGKFNKTHFIQIVNNAIVLKKYKWVRKFINESSDSLVEEHREPIKALAEGLLYIGLKKYNKVIESLNRVEFIDARDKVQEKNLRARAYYDLGEHDTLLSHIDTAKHFLRKNRTISESRKESYVNFYNYLQKLAVAREKMDDVSINQLKKKIISEKRILFRNWLLERVERLK